MIYYSWPDSAASFNWRAEYEKITINTFDGDDVSGLFVPERKGKHRQRC